MSVPRIAMGSLVALIGLAVLGSLALIPLGKPTPWQLIGAPELVNSQNLVSDSGEPDFIWTVHLNEVGVGLVPCGGFASSQPKAGDPGTFCAKGKGIELKNSASGTALKIGKTTYRYDCEPDGAPAAGLDPLLKCKVNSRASLFG